MNNNADPNDSTDSSAGKARPTAGSSPSAKKHPSKKQIAIALLRRAQGASRAELEAKLGWQPHSIRGFLSGTARKLEEFDLIAQQTKSGQRRYRLVAKAAA